MHLRVAESVDGGFDDIDLAALLRCLLSDSPEHFKTDNRRSVFAQDDVIDIKSFSVIIDKDSTEPFPGDLNRSDNADVAAVLIPDESECSKVHVLICGEHAQKSFIERGIDKSADPVVNEIGQDRDFFVFAKTQHLSLFTDHENVGFEDIAHDSADIIENDFSCVVVVQQSFDFSGIIEQLYIADRLGPVQFSTWPFQIIIYLPAAVTFRVCSPYTRSLCFHIPVCFLFQA